MVVRSYFDKQESIKAVEKVYKDLEIKPPSTIKNHIGTITLQALVP